MATHPDSDGWTIAGESILSPKNLDAIEHHLAEVGVIILQHWHYRGARAPSRLFFEEFDDFKNYLSSQVRPGDAIDVWPFPTDIRTAIAMAKYPDSEGRVPTRGAY